MPKVILVPVDGSDHAAKALDLAAGMAKAGGADLVLIHVLTERKLSDDERRLAEVEYAATLRGDPVLGRLIPAAGDAGVMAPAILSRARENEMAARKAIGKRLLDDARDRARQAGAKVADAVLDVGDPAARIVETAKRLGAGQIVMGARGLGGFGSLVLGSVSQAVIHQAQCPCTVVK